jgi:hypothetical protein
MKNRIVLMCALLLSPVVAFATVTGTATSATFTCTNSTGPYPFSFPVSSATALTVTQNGIVLAPGNYTISPVNNSYDNGGSVTLNTACPSGQTLVLQRVTPVTQLTQFTPYMPALYADIEDGLDQLTEIDQELYADYTTIKPACGTVPIGIPCGGTGATTAAGALVNLGTEQIAQGGTGATTASGALANLFQAVNVKAYGALGDGSTDDGPAIRAAIAVGADVYFPCSAQPYYINSLAGNFNNNSWALELGSNQTLYSDSPGCATIKMGNGLVNAGGQTYGSGMLLLLNVNNTTVKNITIDMNGLNNLVPSGGAIRNAIGIKIQGSSQITISNTAILNSSGQNAIAADATSSYITVDHVNTLWGGTSLPGNIYQTDWSAFYSEADFTSFTNNTIINSVTSYPFIAAAGGIELHGSHQTADNNTISYCLPCYYLQPVAGTQTDVHITNTRGSHVFSGLIQDGGNVVSVDFSGNTFLMDPNNWGVSSQNPYGIWQFSGTISQSNFHDNTFIESDTAEYTTGTTIGIAIPAISNSTIHHNRMENMAAWCFYFNTPTTGMSNVTIDDNHCLNFGYNTSGNYHHGVYLSSPAGGTISNVNWINNELSLPTSQPSAQGFSFNWNPAITLGSLKISGNTLLNIGVPQGGSSSAYTAAIPGYDKTQWTPSLPGAFILNSALGYTVGRNPIGNLLLLPSTFNTSPWAESGFTFTPNAAISPDGTYDAMQAVSSGGHNLYQTLNVAASTSYIFTVYGLNNGGIANLNYAIYCNTTSAYIVTFGPYSTALSGNWTQLSATFAVPAGCTNINIYVAGNEATPVNAYLWGATLSPTSSSMQGSDPLLMSAGVVTGTGATLCTDANLGTTTIGCAVGTSVQASVTSSNVTMTTAGTYYDGPTTGSQAAGTWLIQGTVSLQTSATPTAAINFTCKLWDGTTVFSSTGDYIELTTVGATKDISLSLSAVATEAGAATFKISCTSDTASQLILYQTAYGSVANASSISAVRIK